MNLESWLGTQGWDVVATLNTETREEQVFSVDDIKLSEVSRRMLDSPPINGQVYRHQKIAIGKFLDGKNICMSTGTASGKSLAFQVAALECLAADPKARIIAIYPMKALGREQQKRWKKTMGAAGLDRKVGRIDGSVAPARRPQILRESGVVIFTPDVIHAWLLSHLHDRVVSDFLRNVRLIIVDEVHTYSGVFGSNAAFLFRRIRHIMGVVGASTQFFGASATIAEPKSHLRNLFGLEFVLVDESKDTSPGYGLEISLANPPGNSHFFTEITDLLSRLEQEKDSRFITFVDSRVQVEQIATILARAHDEDDEDEQQADEVQPAERKILDDLNVLPYRAGYEPRDRDRIQKRLTDGKLRGVISTSALELGIDIPYLDVCVLVGVPHSSTSLQQRIGRIGRRSPGRVIVINGGTIYDQAVFSDPKSFLDRPLAESALYLENEYIQYIHTLCLARQDSGEHDQIQGSASYESSEEFESPLIWPSGFITLCNSERIGNVPKELQSWKMEANDRPNYAFPLRDVESQFQIEQKVGPERTPLGSLSYSQLMRESYPGAVYYHLTRAYRVYSVLTQEKRVEVRYEKKYTTRPQKYSLVFPKLSGEGLFASRKQGDLTTVECELQIQETITGFRERRGPNEEIINYPLYNHMSVYYEQQHFRRHIFTTGVVITHPALNAELVETLSLAELLFEAFLLIHPFERQDIQYSSDKHRASYRPLIAKGDRFIAIYDQTYGSLRLTRRLLEDDVIDDVFQTACVLAQKQESLALHHTTMDALKLMTDSAREPLVPIKFGAGTSIEILDDRDEFERVIMPGSVGLNLQRNNEEFFIESVFFRRDGLRYRGQTAGQFGTTNARTIARVDDIIEIPTKSHIGYYNYNTGAVEDVEDPLTMETEGLISLTQKVTEQKGGEEVIAIGERSESIDTEELVGSTTDKATQGDNAFKKHPDKERIATDRNIDIEKLVKVLSTRFSEEMLNRLSSSIGVDYDRIPGQSQADRAQWMVSYCEQQKLVWELLGQAYKVYQQQSEAIKEPVEASHER